MRTAVGKVDAMRKATSWVALSVSLMVTAVAPAARAKEAASEKKGAFLGPAEFIALVSKSKKVYKIASNADLKDVSPEAYADVLWPARSKALENPWVVEAPSGDRRPDEYPVPVKVAEILTKAEGLYQDKKFSEALALYRIAASEDPMFALTFANIGDCYFFQDRYAEALDNYRQAIRLNPHDHRLYLFEADALLRLDRPEEAKAALISGLALKPRHETLVDKLTNHAAELGVTYKYEPFVPRVLVRSEGDGVAVYFDSKAHPAWVAYGLCKAAWIGEPEHREALTGSTEHNWTSTEERECLANLVVGARNAEEGKDKPAPDSQIEYVKQVLDEGLIDAFIMYEMGARIHPNAVLYTKDALRADLVRYVSKYVVVAAGKPAVTSPSR